MIDSISMYSRVRERQMIGDMTSVILRHFRSPELKRCFKSDKIKDEVVGICLGDAGGSVRSVFPFILVPPRITFK